MADNIFENLTDEEQNNLWMYMIFNRDKITEKTEQWTKEAEKSSRYKIKDLQRVMQIQS